MLYSKPQFNLPTIPPMEWFLCVAVFNRWKRRRECEVNYRKRNPARYRKNHAAQQRRARRKHAEKHKALEKARYIRRRLKQLEYKRRTQNRTRLIKQEWRAKNRGRVRAVHKAIYHRRKHEPAFRVTYYLRNRMRRLLSNRSEKLLSLVGCSAETLIKHLEAQFSPGMSWGNYGKNGWHIDHRIPCSKFDLNREDHVRQCFHWTNLVPLWWIDNLRKYNRIGTEFGNTQATLGI